jgi:hypothetical protein
LLKTTDIRGLSDDDAHTLAPGLEPMYRDRSFSQRLPGLNVDYMSYSMLQMVDGNETALQDLETLFRTANATFATFFQHFASSNTSLDTGGWAYSRIGEALPKDLGMRVPTPGDAELFNSRPLAPAVSVYDESLDTVVAVSVPVEALQMSTTATFISVAILASLLLILLVAVIAVRRQQRLLRNIDCTADVLILFANSEHLLRLVRQRGLSSLLHDPYLRYRLGWFWATDGTAVWGIESTNRGHASNQSQEAGARFLTNAEIAAMATSGSTNVEKNGRLPSRRWAQHRWWPFSRNREQQGGKDSTVALVAPRQSSMQSQGPGADISEHVSMTPIASPYLSEDAHVPPVHITPTYYSTSIPKRKPVPTHRYNSLN